MLVRNFSPAAPLLREDFSFRELDVLSKVGKKKSTMLSNAQSKLEEVSLFKPRGSKPEPIASLLVLQTTQLARLSVKSEQKNHYQTKDVKAAKETPRRGWGAEREAQGPRGGESGGARERNGRRKTVECAMGAGGECSNGDSFANRQEHAFPLSFSLPSLPCALAWLFRSHFTRFSPWKRILVTDTSSYG